VAKTKKSDPKEPTPVIDEQDKETLAAIDEGIRDADAGRVVSAELVHEDWVAIAQEMARNARAGLAAQRKRLQEILAERERNQSAVTETSESPTPRSQR
jgi:hypothetical protein